MILIKITDHHFIIIYVIYFFFFYSVNKLHVKFRVLGNHAAAEVLKEASHVTVSVAFFCLWPRARHVS